MAVIESMHALGRTPSGSLFGQILCRIFDGIIELMELVPVSEISFFCPETHINGADLEV